MPEFNIAAHPNFPERARLFHEKYDLIDIIFPDDERFSYSHLNDCKERICRFCNKKMPDVTFENDAHLVSRFLGNKELFSDFECDECNLRFSYFESDLASYLGIARSIIGLSDDSKPPSFVTQRLSLKSRSFIGENILILYKEDLNEENSEENRKAGITSITYTKPQYIPINVYKALIKCSLSILPEQQVKDHYSLALKLLEGQVHLKGAHIYGYNFPFLVNIPFHVQIFKKKKSADNILTHVIGFYFQNHIFYLPLPLHNDDMRGFNQDVEIPYAPPYFLNPSEMFSIVPNAFYKDLSTLEKIKDDVETFTMVVNPENLSKAAKYDPIKGEISLEPYNPMNTKYIIIMRTGVTFSAEQLKQLTEFLEKEEAKLTNKKT